MLLYGGSVSIGAQLRVGPLRASCVHLRDERGRRLLPGVFVYRGRAHLLRRYLRRHLERRAQLRALQQSVYQRFVYGGELLDDPSPSVRHRRNALLHNGLSVRRGPRVQCLAHLRSHHHDVYRVGRDLHGAHGLLRDPLVPPHLGDPSVLRGAHGGMHQQSSVLRVHVLRLGNLRVPYLGPDLRRGRRLLLGAELHHGDLPTRCGVYARRGRDVYSRERPSGVLHGEQNVLGRGGHQPLLRGDGLFLRDRTGLLRDARMSEREVLLLRERVPHYDGLLPRPHVYLGDVRLGSVHAARGRDLHPRWGGSELLRGQPYLRRSSDNQPLLPPRGRGVYGVSRVLRGGALPGGIVLQPIGADLHHQRELLHGPHVSIGDVPRSDDTRVLPRRRGGVYLGSARSQLLPDGLLVRSRSGHQPLLPRGRGGVYHLARVLRGGALPVGDLLQPNGAELHQQRELLHGAHLSIGGVPHSRRSGLQPLRVGDVYPRGHGSGVLHQGYSCSPAPTTNRCCHATGGTCSTSLGCCGADFCVGGRCCRSSGASCTATSQCCSALSCISGTCRTAVCSLSESSVCTSGGTAPNCCTTGYSCAPAPSTSRCCHTTGGACSTSLGCCGADFCIGGRCCRPSAQSCSLSSQCCSGLSCISGTCRTPTCSLTESSACTPGGAAPNCCTTGYSCLPSPSTNRCCHGSGGTCSTSLGCCALLICSAGRCR